VRYSLSNRFRCQIRAPYSRVTFFVAPNPEDLPLNGRFITDGAYNTCSGLSLMGVRR